MNTLEIAPKSYCQVYLRRSQDREDRQQLSLEKQDNQVKDIFKEYKNLVPLYLPPEEASAKKPGRPIFNEMVAKIEAGEIRYIAVWHLSRLSRNSIDGGRIIYLLDTGQLLAIFTPTRVYRNTPDDKAFLAIELAFAKKNNDDLGVQVKESYVIKRLHGEYPGPAFLGYDNIIIRPGVRNIAPNDEGKKLYYVFVYASTGMYTLDDVWRCAQDIGLKAPKDDTKLIAKSTLENALKRRDYTGWFKRGGTEWIEGSYEALIDIDLFNKVQQAMGWAGKHHSANSTSGRSYTYKGPLVCGGCGFNVTAYTKPKTLASGLEAEYVFYTCTKKNKTKVCEEPQLAEDKLATEVRAEVSNFEIDEAVATNCKAMLHNLFNDYQSQQNRYISVWEHDKSKAQKALDVLDTKLEAGVMTDERYMARSKQHEQTIARTTKLLNGSSKDAELWLELATELFSGVTNIGDVFAEADDADKRHLMLYLGSNWTLSNKKVALTPREPLSLLHKSNPHSDWRDIESDFRTIKKVVVL
jgi:site-specific DNA recombinase